MDKNPFLKYLIKDEKKDVVHTSAFSVAQNGEAMGAASAQSFEERRKIDANRQIIRGYNDSKLANQSRMNAPRPKTYTPPTNGGSLGAMRNGGATQSRMMMQRKNPGI